jgi:hypothetical protein
MKLFDDNMQAGQAGNFGFSGVRPDKLGSTEYTLVTYTGDKTGSLQGFEAVLLETKRAVVEACKKSPRAEFLLVRNTEFNNHVDEVHGFAELATIDPSQYQEPRCTGTTALYDATYNAVAATNEYAKTLSDADFSVNGIVFVVTDGAESPHASVQTPKSIAEEIRRGVQNEWLESLIVVLIGVNAAQCSVYLEEFKKEAKLTQYVDAGDATPQRLGKLADFVSRSISSQSQALGTGGPSQPLTF